MLELIPILLVDDHVENLIALEAVLQDERYELVCATSGQEALRKVLQGNFAVIVMDVQMPEMDGFEAARLIKMRGKSRETPIIFVTAADQSPSVYTAAYSSGAIDYIRKPFQPEILKAKIDGFVRLHETNLRLAHQAELLQQQTDELEKANKEVLAASMVKTRFLATMSHELRTPMNGVIGVADLLLSTELSEEQRMYVETIRSSGGALLRILNDILDFAKMESGGMTLTDTPFDLQATLQETTELFMAKAKQKGIRLHWQIDPATPRIWNGDDSRLRQVLMNLISNAVKFTHTGEVLVTVCLSRGNKQGGIPEAALNHPAVVMHKGLLVHPDTEELEFRISDTGEGIPPGREEELFRPFTQLSSFMTRKHEGTGLGLSICKFLVELMGGSICYEPQEEGSGAVFIFTVRLKTLSGNQSVSAPWVKGIG